MEPEYRQAAPSMTELFVSFLPSLEPLQ